MQPKYAVGDIFYDTRRLTDKKQPNTTLNKYNDFFYIPIALIITQIIIDRKNITYKVKGYVKNNKDIEEAESTKTEKELDKSFLSINDVLQYINKKTNEAFVDLTRAINKEKLSDVLHGK